MIILYIETNFILEIVMNQQQSCFAEDIIALAENGKIEIAVPSFALIEPFWTLNNRKTMRTKSYNSLSESLNSYKQVVPSLKVSNIIDPILEDLQKTEAEQDQRFNDTISRLLQVAIILEISPDTYGQALNNLIGLSYLDGIIYFSILDDLKNRDIHQIKCFTSLNWKDFDFTQIKDDLGKYNCTYIPNFEHCKKYLESKLK